MGVTLRSRKTKNGLSYYLDIIHNNERRYEFINVEIKRQMDKGHKVDLKSIAEAIRNKRERELIILENDITIAIGANRSFLEYWDDFIVKSNYSKDEKKKTRSAYLKFQEFYKGKDINIKALNHDTCQRFVEFLSHHPKIKSKETISSYFTVFRRVLNKAVKDEIIMKSPAAQVKPPKVFKKMNKEVLTMDEIKLLASTPTNSDIMRRAFLFCCLTGLGYKDLSLLDWRNIRDNQISYTQRSKSSVPLDIPLSDDAMALMGKKEKSGKVFHLPSQNALKKTLNKWIVDAGIDKHITWYCARHSFACNLLIHGANQKTVANLMGHTETRTTDKYLNHVSTLNRAAIDALPKLTI